MAQSVSEFFEALPTRVDPSKTAGMNNSYRLRRRRTQARGRSRHRTARSRSPQDGDAKPDVTIATSEETFQKLLSGEQNPTTAYMTGKLKIKGDMGAAMKLQKLF